MNITKRLEALEFCSQAEHDRIAQTAAALERLVDNGVLVFTGLRFIAGDNAPDTMPPLADLLNLARERWERDQQ
jgi:hypothetical protein